mgnify:CR=1 FL=1
MCKTYIPTNQLFDAFIQRVLHYEISSYNLSKNWKRERPTEDCYILTHSSGTVETLTVLHSWNDRMNKNSRFPLCAVKHTASDKEEVIFYTFIGFEDSWDLFQLVVHRARFTPLQSLKQSIFLQKAHNIYPISTKTEEKEWEEVQHQFEECFTEDPATRLWAVTGNLF